MEPHTLQTQRVQLMNFFSELVICLFINVERISKRNNEHLFQRTSFKNIKWNRWNWWHSLATILVQFVLVDSHFSLYQERSSNRWKSESKLLEKSLQSFCLDKINCIWYIHLFSMQPRQCSNELLIEVVFIYTWLIALDQILCSLWW